MKLSLLIKLETSQKIRKITLLKEVMPRVLPSKYDLGKADCKMLRILIDMHRLAVLNSLGKIFNIFLIMFFYCIPLTQCLSA